MLFADPRGRERGIQGEQALGRVYWGYIRSAVQQVFSWERWWIETIVAMGKCAPFVALSTHWVGMIWPCEAHST
ncbi:MAG: hypothetical protein M1415_07075 [Firmicutes bacterium]|nr:hypothetical protein [Bacillota bacterium]MCL5066102.1 hypothetical protein [Bacillota bacterium]